MRSHSYRSLYTQQFQLLAFGCFSCSDIQEASDKSATIWRQNMQANLILAIIIQIKLTFLFSQRFHQSNALLLWTGEAPMKPFWLHFSYHSIHGFLMHDTGVCELFLVSYFISFSLHLL